MFLVLALENALIEPEHQRATAAPNTVQRIGPCSATPQTGRGLPGAWRQRQRDRRVHVGRSCGGRRGSSGPQGGAACKAVAE
jgi:hypothetical protein